ncbi:MAG: diacylglycerol kinase family protein [Planctomycetota bacterium]|nr:diacylglycerol kinase family protein [Planctomycetota bacterium]
MTPTDAANPPRRVLLIANPISGGGRGRELAPRLAAALRSRGVEAEVYLTCAGGDAAARAAAAGPEPWDGLIALGGDGTVNEVLNGMPDPSRPLGVLPVGTANVLALELALPRDVDDAAAVIARGHLHELAIGTCGDRRFLLFVGAGIDGAIVKRVSDRRTGTLGKHKWIAPLLHTAWRWPLPQLEVTCDDGVTLTDVSSVLITRVATYGGIMRLPDADRDSGELHVLAFHIRSRWSWLYHGLRATLGRLRPGRHLTIRRAKVVRVSGEAPFQIDGDYGGKSPVEVSLLPTRARLYAPPQHRG